jgi:hypothetical protein
MSTVMSAVLSASRRFHKAAELPSHTSRVVRARARGGIEICEEAEARLAGPPPQT